MRRLTYLMIQKALMRNKIMETLGYY
ncbi:rCG53360, isoform CRA_a [Rattus norvegicus]|uniref:RCG53360, isoform CRA_a n=1 Tax=Rattus norvegicus TaxID=10116 RepID=A6KUQ9_RAT|nr:rCG53360, isoform CRA_a [Rattus norvegicus]